MKKEHIGPLRCLIAKCMDISKEKIRVIVNAEPKSRLIHFLSPCLVCYHSQQSFLAATFVAVS